MKKPNVKSARNLKIENFQLNHDNRNLMFSILVLFLGVVMSSFSSAKKDDIYPLIAPYEKGFIDTGEGHELYYEKSGNAFGEPVIVLHDGPGGKSNEAFKRFFDPKIYNIIQFDQRGCGRSVAKNQLQKNATADLIKDINTIAQQMELETFTLSGIGWGATLAVYYTQQFPEKVNGLIVSGFNFYDSKDIEQYYKAFSKADPELYKAFLKNIKYDGNPSSIPSLTYKTLMASEETAEVFRKLHSKATKVGVSDATALRATTLNEAVINNYYLMNNCFIEKDEIRNNLKRISEIPAYIIIGDRDIIARMENSIHLHKEMHKSALDIVPNAAHNDYEIALAFKKGSIWMADHLKEERQLLVKNSDSL